MSENFFKNKNKVTQKKSNGFTLIELVTVIAIMGAMTSIVLFNFRSFSIKLEFDNLSQDIALRIVQAQKTAMTGVQNVAFTGLGHDIKPAYGVYFSAAPASTSTIGNTKFTYFADIPASTATTGDKLYNPPTGSSCGDALLSPECLAVTTITTGEYIDDICFSPNQIPSGNNCVSGTTDDVSIVFVRPFPDATITVRRPGGSAGGTPTLENSACIEIATPLDPSSKRTIKVNSLGQVTTYDTAATSSSTACY